MSTIVILAFGTRGDVAPLTGLGARIRDDLGVAVAIAAQKPYEQMIVDAGLIYRWLPHDTEKAVRASAYGQAMVDGHKLRPSREALQGMRDDLAGVGEAMAEAASDSDLVLCGGPVGSLLGWHVAESLGIRSAVLSLQPAFPTGDFGPPPLGARSFGRWANRLTWSAAATGEKLFTPLIDQVRSELGLGPISRRRSARLRSRSWPQLAGFSEHVVPRPHDWPSHVHVTGYWWPQDDSSYAPPPDVEAFLADGPPPIYVGLGSTATTHGAEISTMVVDALVSTGQRGIIHRGWAHLDGSHADPSVVMTVDDVPHSWLFPRMAGAIHHCGAGTAAATLRAGIPSIALPGIMDQPFWAERLRRLGVTSAVLQRHTATGNDVARAIDELVTEPSHSSQAHDIAGLLANEDGAGAAVEMVERLMTDDVVAS